MRTFTLLIWDRRYSVPTLDVRSDIDEPEVVEFARRDLRSNVDHLAVEIWEAEDLVAVERRAAHDDEPKRPAMRTQVAVVANDIGDAPAA